MRFGVVEESDDEGYQSFEEPTDSEDELGSELNESFRVPRSDLGLIIKNYMDDSDSDEEQNLDNSKGMESEDEVELLGDGVSIDARSARAKSSTTTSITMRPEAFAESSRDPWRTAKQSSPLQKGILPELNADHLESYDAWLQAEKEAMREGNRRYRERRQTLREIEINARHTPAPEMSSLERDLAEMSMNFENMAIKKAEQDKEVKRRFEQRQKRLWEDIEAIIKYTERREAEAKAAALAEARRKEQEAAAKIAAQEKAALARKAEAERLAKEHMAREAAEREAEKEARDMAEKAAAEAEAAQQEKDRKAGQAYNATKEWMKWVDLQKRIKKDVIEPVKSDRALRTELRQGLRLITRGLGQVVNTQGSIVRVAGDIHKIISERLPTSPTPATPVKVDDNPPTAYLYLLSHLSKALIKQAESEVSAKVEAGFPLARIILILLMNGHAALGEVLFARLVKKCPWVVPHYPARMKDQPREEYEKSTGRGVDESLADYVARMVGITTLLFTIMQTPLSSLLPTVPSPPTPDQLTVLIPPPMRSTGAWTWLANVLKDPLPALPPVASMIISWIEVVGPEAMRLWGQTQIRKVFEAIKKEGVEGGKVKGDSEAARQKLGLILNNPSALEYPKARQWE